MRRLNRGPARPIWQPSGNMLCDVAVTHAFDAVPNGAPAMADPAKVFCAYSTFHQATEEKNG
jgi:hypothetical protein